MTVPAIPDPQRIALANLGSALERSALVRDWCKEHRDLETANRLRRALDGLAKMVADRKARPAVEAEQRLTETLIGGLLGPAVIGRPRKSLSDQTFDTDDLNDHQLAEFRLMAENTEIVEELVTHGITARKAILREIRKAQLRAAASAHAGVGYELMLGDILDAGANIAANSVDVILTDPPYDLEAVRDYGRLAELAARVLRPGGSMFVMVGQWHLPVALDGLTANAAITYHWTLAYMTPGQAAFAATISRRVNAGWKPVIWLTKGAYEGRVIGDVARSARNEKEHHHWGQSVSGIEDLVTRCTEEGDHVLDPFVGGGTIGYVALALGRTFIGIDRDPEALAVAAGRLAGD